MVFCCSDRKEPKGLGMEEQRVKKVHLYTTQSSVVVTFCEILRFFLNLFSLLIKYAYLVFTYPCSLSIILWIKDV